MATSLRTSIATIAMLLAWISAARAQDAPRMQIGASGGTIVSWFTEAYFGGDVRVTTPVNENGDVEVLAGIPSAEARREGLAGFYAVQYRQRIRKGATATLQPFATYGAMGLVMPGSDPVILPPFIGLVGGGVERRFAGGVALRVEAQGVVAIIVPAGIRMAAGLTVPIGPARR